MDYVNILLKYSSNMYKYGASTYMSTEYKSFE